MNIQEILEKLTDEQKRELLEATRVDIELEARNNAEKKPSESNWVSKILGGDVPYTDV